VVIVARALGRQRSADRGHGGPAAINRYRDGATLEVRNTPAVYRALYAEAVGPGRIEVTRLPTRLDVGAAAAARSRAAGRRGTAA
jgi:endonuclease YncB( thermonuclease family)